MSRLEVSPRLHCRVRTRLFAMRPGHSSTSSIQTWQRLPTNLKGCKVVLQSFPRPRLAWLGQTTGSTLNRSLSSISILPSLFSPSAMIPRPVPHLLSTVCSAKIRSPVASNFSLTPSTLRIWPPTKPSSLDPLLLRPISLKHRLAGVAACPELSLELDLELFEPVRRRLRRHLKVWPGLAVGIFWSVIGRSERTNGSKGVFNRRVGSSVELEWRSEEVGQEDEVATLPSPKRQNSRQPQPCARERSAEELTRSGRGGTRTIALESLVDCHSGPCTGLASMLRCKRKS